MSSAGVSEKIFIHRDQEAGIKAKALYESGFFGQSSQVCFSCILDAKRAPELRFWNDEEVAFEDRLSDYLLGTLATKPIFKNWHNSGKQGIDEEKAAAAQDYAHEVFDSKLMKLLGGIYPLQQEETATSVVYESLSLARDVEEQGYGVACLLADAIATRRITFEQFALLREELGITYEKFALNRSGETWMGFGALNKSGIWEFVSGAYCPSVFDRRMKLLASGLALTPLFAKEYEFGDRYQKEDFAKRLRTAFSSEVLTASIAISELPNGHLTLSALEDLKQMRESAEGKKKEAILFFQGLWKAGDRGDPTR